MKVIFSTNLPSPYRVDFFNELGKHCDLTVLYERKVSAERNSKWKGVDAQNFKEIYLDLTEWGVDLAKGPALKNYIKEHKSDILIFTNYSSPATREAIIWCRLHGRKYYMEYDGGFNKKDSLIKRMVKKFLLKGATGHLTTAEEHIKYLMSLGIHRDTIYKYPFTSVTQTDLTNAYTALAKGREYYRKKLGITEKHMILTVGRFSNGTAYRKGYDILMEVAQKLKPSIGIYFIGEKPSEDFTKLKAAQNLNNVHFVGFKTKQELADYYITADLFILLTREDIWGLVINEALSYGLPIITTTTCIAGLELVEPEVNGYLVDYRDLTSIINSIHAILDDSDRKSSFGKHSLEKIKKYTISEMCKRHIEIFDLLISDGK